ncbi:MAG: hypothetical protein CMJ49_08040 [Planctomycetaceae bacterium]|nr:hypothetical protein [Planctomycetaceae bacterium]
MNGSNEAMGLVSTRGGWRRRVIRALMVILLIVVVYYVGGCSLQRRIMFPRHLLGNMGVGAPVPRDVESLWIDITGWAG